MKGEEHKPLAPFCLDSCQPGLLVPRDALNTHIRQLGMTVDGCVCVFYVVLGDKAIVLHFLGAECHFIL